MSELTQVGMSPAPRRGRPKGSKNKVASGVGSAPKPETDLFPTIPSAILETRQVSASSSVSAEGKPDPKDRSYYQQMWGQVHEQGFNQVLNHRYHEDDPNYDYRFCSTRDGRAIANNQRWGFEESVIDSKTGMEVTKGELVLKKRPKAAKELRDQMKLAAGKKQVDSTRVSVISAEEARKAGLPGNTVFSNERRQVVSGGREL